MANARSDNAGATSLNTLRGRDVAAVVADLEANTPSFGGSNKRKAVRHRYHPNANVVVALSHPGGTVVRFAVAARNLSETGIGFLHGSFVHQDTRCVVCLETLGGQWTNVQGTVRRCSYLRNQIHEVGVRFEQPIDLSQFITVEPGADPSVPDRSLKLAGRVLYIEDSPTDRELMRYHLEQLGVQSVMIGSVAEAMAMIDADVAFDLVVTDYHLQDGGGATAVFDGLRQRQCAQPVVLVTADESQAVRDEAVRGGCQGVLIKPFDREDLTNLLLQFLSLAGGAQRERGGERLVSTMWGDEAMRPLITTYLQQLQTQAGELERLIAAAGDGSALHGLLMDIKGSSGSFGFTRISRGGQQLLALISAQAPREAVDAQARELVQLCRRALETCPAQEKPRLAA